MLRLGICLQAIKYDLATNAIRSVVRALPMVTGFMVNDITLFLNAVCFLIMLNTTCLLINFPIFVALVSFCFASNSSFCSLPCCSRCFASNLSFSGACF